jgi:hypothetical protein
MEKENLCNQGTDIGPSPPANGTEELSYKVERRGRYWALLDSGGALVCITVYLKGAEEVKRRLETQRR